MVPVYYTLRVMVDKPIMKCTHCNVERHPNWTLPCPVKHVCWSWTWVAQPFQIVLTAYLFVFTSLETGKFGDWLPLDHISSRTALKFLVLNQTIRFFNHPSWEVVVLRTSAMLITLSKNTPFPTCPLKSGTWNKAHCSCTWPGHRTTGFQLS